MFYVGSNQIIYVAIKTVGFLFSSLLPIQVILWAHYQTFKELKFEVEEERKVALDRPLESHEQKNLYKPCLNDADHLSVVVVKDLATINESSVKSTKMSSKQNLTRASHSRSSSKAQH